MTKGIRAAVGSGVAAGVRRDSLALAPGRHGEPDSRVVRLVGQPEVILRTAGDRDAWSIPGSEIGALAMIVADRSPTMDRKVVKREVARLLGSSRYTAALDKLLDAVIATEIGSDRR
jgi:hypothetical protein